MATYLADKSALTRSDTRPEVREALEPLLLSGEVATCGIVDLELLYSASSRATYRALSEALRGMPRAAIDVPRGSVAVRGCGLSLTALLETDGGDCL